MSWSEMGSHWWALVIAAVTGFLGWRVKSAQDSVRLEQMRDELARLQTEWAAFKAETTLRLGQQDVREARLETRLDAIMEGVQQLRADLRGKADR